MNTQELKNLIETWDSLVESMERAGGKTRISQIYNMSAIEFIAFIAPNGIRFANLSTPAPESQNDKSRL